MFRTNVRRGHTTSTGVRRGGAASGSCEGAAAGPRDGAASVRQKGAATRSCGEPAQNLTFKIKFPAANICSKFEKFCQIFNAHSTSCDFVCGYVPTNRNLKKFQNSFIIYIESEGKRKENSQLRTSIFLHFHAGVRNK